MKKSKRVVTGADLHFPKYDKPTFKGMLEVIKDIKPSIFVFKGDQFDNEEISHHNAKKPIYKERRSYVRNMEQFEDEILGPLNSVLASSAERVWIIGNHDDWEFQFVEEHPEFEGLVDRVSGLSLVKRGWKVVPLGHAYQLGELNIIHGEILTGFGNQVGMYPSRKAVELYGSNVLAAHTHSPQSFSRVSPVEHRRKHMGWISPILGATNPAYLRNRPTSWINGFNVIEQHGTKGYFNLFPVFVFDGKFAFGGKQYGY